MAFIGLKVPHETARLLHGIDFGGVGDREPTDFYHVTLHALGDDIPIETLAEAVAPIFEVVSKTHPFTVSTHHVGTFPPHPEHGTVPVICHVDSPELHALHAAIGEALDKAGIDYSKRFPKYQPHVTLAYSKDPKTEVDVHLPKPIGWSAHELVLWGGDTGDNRVVMTFPFSLQDSSGKSASAHGLRDVAYRAVVRLSMWSGRPGWRRRVADDHTPVAPCPICGGEPVYDSTLDAFVCPTCGLVGGQEISRKVAARFKAL